MYRNKRDVDKHVENLINKLSVKEFKSRAYSVARLYFGVGEFANCQKYVEQYLTLKDNNAAAYKLLGQALQKLGQKDKALDHYKTSLELDPTQTSTILDICELLADDGLAIEPGRAEYWCEKAEATFPKHPITFRLRERLVTLSNPDPEALVKLLMAELEARPKDPSLHGRLIKHYINIKKYKEAFEYSCNVEFSTDNFINNYAWYEILDDLFKHNLDNSNDWLYQLLLLTVRERICVLSLTETPSGNSKSLVESNELLHAYDQALERVANAGAPTGFAEFHASLLQHHRGQFAFHAATLLLKKAKKDQLSWRDANKVAAPLMLIAWQTVPLDSKVNWLKFRPEKLLNAVSRWYTEGTYRCSQSGHYLISNFQDKNQSFLDQIIQCCSGTHWKDKLYEKIFPIGNLLSKKKSSHFTSIAFNAPVPRLPRKIEVEAFDGDAQKQYGNSLHHFVWTLLNYKNFAHFKCTLFDMLTPTVTSCAPETLNKLDIHAFLYCAALTTKQQKASNEAYLASTEKPITLPANITDLLCPLSQMKWWDCAYKFSQNVLGTELTDIRATLSRGIEVVRCVDNHGLDVELLCMLGRIFSERAKTTTSVEEKTFLEVRAGLYYNSAIPFLEKLKSKVMIKVTDKRMFDYTHKELGNRELNLLLEESKLYVALNHLNDCEYDKAIEILSNVKSSQAYYHLAQTFKQIAQEEMNSSTDDSNKSKYAALLAKAKTYAYKALDMLKNTETNKNNPLYIDTQEMIEDIEIRINKIDPDISTTLNDIEAKYSSDENFSCRSESMRTNNNLFRNISSTPKAPSNPNVTNYRTAIDSQMLEMTRIEQQNLERIENEIKNLQKRDSTINDFMSQTRDRLDENCRLGKQIMSTINSNMQDTTDQFKLLKISVDNVKDQIEECRNECKDVVELKKQVAELRKEVDKLKKTSEETMNANDMYNLDDEYRNTENSTNYASAQLPFPPQMLPQFNPRPPFPLPPNPYQLYNQTLYNLYNQYSQFAQPSSVPGAPPLFDASRTQMNYPGVYPTQDQMYLDMAHLIPAAAPVVPAASVIPTIPVVPTLPTTPLVSAPTLPAQTLPAPTTAPKTTTEPKEVPRSLPVNVVITSSDPLPTCATTPAPVLSVTIPSKHIKGTPHNYQITMPTVSENKTSSPPVFSFSMPDNKTTSSSSSNWKQTFQTFGAEESSLYKVLHGDSSHDYSKTVVDGPFSGASPNTSLNKSRTLSEKSNTSIENYDPCPDFKPIVPLPAEVRVTTGEEDEIAIFSSRAKLFRFVDKQWKERGVGEMKLLKHQVTGKVRVLMRREQVHKICANHIITSEMKIQPMKNETKAYFWCANDFAEETIVLEKFSIRFKTADIAKDFYDAFEKARLESQVAMPNTDSHENKKNDKSATQQFIQSESSTLAKESAPTFSQNKIIAGGFTFSSTPLFKPVENDSKPGETTTDSATKGNVFSGLTFKSSTSLPFSNLFNTTAALETAPAVKTEKLDVNNRKLNTSDTIEEYEPNVEFKPVIPLPALVEQKTGEEDEHIMFEHRAKLLRFDSNTKEWKERGLGNIKLLMHKNNNQKLRLLMRREQIMKVCCNHAITKELIFQKMPNMNTAVTWCAKDFSEGELVTETFCLRFKTEHACDEFMQAVKSAQIKLKDDTKSAKEEQNAAKQSSGFGDKFKAKPGSWQCESCYTNNLETFTKCACCEQPKEDTIITNNTAQNTSSATTSSWGDKYKPKPGSWECQSCCVRNEATLEKCSACNSPKDPSAAKSSLILAADNTSKFCFGIPSQTSASILNQPKTESNNIKSLSSGNGFNFGLPSQTSSTLFNTPKTDTYNDKSTVSLGAGFGGKFKPKEGTWECKQCLIRNESSSENCVACNSPKDPNAPKKSTNTIDTPATTIKFRFGIPPTPTNDEKPETEPATIFDGKGGYTFNFGIPNDQKPTAAIFAAPKVSSETDTPVNFSVKKSEELKKPALLPTPQIDPVPVGTKESSGFGFVFKPTTSSKSPLKSPNKSRGDESDGEDYVKDEDCHAHFNPVIPMPDKVEVITGEENETELYGHRARLYRFVSGVWKERGTGIVKILKQNETNKLRVVMRREQVLKICLNHALTAEILYKSKDDKSWLFVANDYSEGELSLEHLCLRFQSKDIALQFKEAIDNALQGKPVTVAKAENKPEAGEKDDVIFVCETQASVEDKKKAKELMLPENFYNYKNKKPCPGCRGCKDNEDKPEPSPSPAIKALLTAPPVTSSPSVTSTGASTPVKSTFPTFQSPANSMYGTPGGSMDKTLDNSIFRTPLGTIGFNTKTLTPGSNNNDATGIDATNKENIFTQKPNIFSNIGGQKPILSTSTGSGEGLFGSGDAQAGSVSSSPIAPSKLSFTTTTGDNQSADPKSIFASAAAKSFCGIQADTSISGNVVTSTNNSMPSVPNNKPNEESNTQVKSLFGGNDQKVTNIFGVAAQGSLFGPGSLGNQSNPSYLFGATAAQNDVFKSIFSKNTTNQQSIWNTAPGEEKKADVSIFGASDSKTKSKESKEKEKEETKESLFKIDESLSFASMSTSGPGFAVQKKADFQWEGAGQQLFTGDQKALSKNDSGAGEEAAGEEEYDPHYEPIVPLPEKIVVTTGEEDEQKVFGERCKLYRYDEKTREWKERGVGEMKILYHPERNTYRLLLRREQVHKAVLNMLVFMELELLPMTNSDRAWTWLGRNYAETAAGEQETLAVRFKSVDLAKSFQEQVVQCTRKLQAAAAKAIREAQEAKDAKDKTFGAVAPLRLPKHLADTARADGIIVAATAQQAYSQPQGSEPERKPNGDSNADKPDAGHGTPDSKQATFQEPEEQVEEVEEVEEEEEDEDYDHDYDQNDYDAYYNEEDDTAYYSCEGEVLVRQGVEENHCPQAHIQVLFDQEIYSPKILVTDAATGEILADMLIHTDTEFQMSGDTCTWVGTDYTTNDPVDKSVTVNFYDSFTATQFYDSCETSKAATYSSNDPES